MYGPKFAEIYDAVYTLRGKDYEAEAEYVAKVILARRPGAVSLLDVACGTGAHLACFGRTFGHVEGLDISEPMLEIARARNPEAALHVADMRSFDLGRRFDAVTCMFTAIAHQRSADELTATLRCFARHLTPEGIAVIDPWWFPETFLDGYVAADVLEPGHHVIARVSHTRRDGEDASLMTVHYVVADESGARHFAETYSHKLFPRGTYEQALRDAGFVSEFIETVPSGRGLFIGALERAGQP
ncbi:methyltransferase domain-containing protein [Streptosporangium sp. LJ11]|uniref:class I SAM-dependent DNA methyltransferase n=1 Tax=Streptosporangium sp. LJ11 TaxID=3436927 RepID=UPI003F7B1783